MLIFHSSNHSFKSFKTDLITKFGATLTMTVKEPF